MPAVDAVIVAAIVAAFVIFRSARVGRASNQGFAPGSIAREACGRKDRASVKTP